VLVRVHFPVVREVWLDQFHGHIGQQPLGDEVSGLALPVRALAVQQGLAVGVQGAGAQRGPAADQELNEIVLGGIVGLHGCSGARHITGAGF
jgi:hypothetical protein